MSRKSLLGIDGRVDPYSLELAQISAEAGVPRIALSESSDPADDLSRDPNTGKGGRVGDIKRRQRLANLRKEDPLAAKGPQDAMKKYLRKKGKPVQDDVSFDDCLDAYLEDHGSSLDEFNMLLDLAIESDDFEMQDELFAVEETLDAILEAGMVQRGKDMFKKGADALAARAEKGRQAGFAASQKSGKAAAPGGAPPKAPAGAPAPAAAPPPTATPSDAGTAAGTPPPAPTSGAPAPGPDAGATASGAPPSPAKPAVGTTGGNTAPASPTQPGQTTKAGDPKKKKDPLNPAGMSAGQKLAQGSANVAVSAPAQLAKGLFGKIKKAGSAMKKGYRGEDVDYWEEFLDENGITVDEYMMVVEDAYENGDEEMIEDLLQLDEAFKKMLRKAGAALGVAKSQAEIDKEQRDKVAGGWASARKVIAKHGKEAVRDASVRGVDVPKKKASGGGTTTNEAIDWMLQMSGYTDEYIAESRADDEKAFLKNSQRRGSKHFPKDALAYKARDMAKASTGQDRKRVMRNTIDHERGVDKPNLPESDNKPSTPIVQHRKTGGWGGYLVRRTEKAFKDIKAKHAGKAQDRAKKSGSTNEAMTKMLQMSGYTDEFIENRAQRVAGKKAIADQGTNDPLATRARVAKKRGVGGVKLTAPSLRNDPAWALSNTGGKKRPLAKLVRKEKGVSEARSEKSAERKSKQYQGLTGSNKDKFISKQASRKGGKKLVKLVDDPRNELAPQLVRTLRRTRR
jgi:hypothetical protein